MYSHKRKRLAKTFLAHLGMRVFSYSQTYVTIIETKKQAGAHNS